METYRILVKNTNYNLPTEPPIIIDVHSNYIDASMIYNLLEVAIRGKFELEFLGYEHINPMSRLELGKKDIEL